MRRFNLKPKLSIRHVFIAGVLLLALILVTVIWYRNDRTNNKKVQAANLTDSCARKSPPSYRCYKQELTSITKTNGPEAAFTLLKQQYPKNAYVKAQCHQLAHVIGRAAYAKYGNIAQTFTHGDQFCWAGYYHGLMEQVADEQGTTKFLANLNTICSQIKTKHKYSFDHYNCVHGLGHGVMEALQEDLFTSLTDCDKLTDSYDSSSCYGGVFMQNIMTVQSPDDTVDHDSAYLKPDDPMYPCTAVADKYKQQCYLMQTSYALQTQNYDFGRVFDLCAQAGIYKITCYQSLGRDASGTSISDVQQTKDKCLLGPDLEAQSNCVVGAAKDFVAYFHSDIRAKQLCASLSQDLQAACDSTVQGFYSTF